MGGGRGGGGGGGKPGGAPGGGGGIPIGLHGVKDEASNTRLQLLRPQILKRYGNMLKYVKMPFVYQVISAIKYL